MRFLLTAILALSVLTSIAKKKPEKKSYNEAYRPVFHFSPEKNWMGSPCGLVYLNDEYHMFFQYNPNGNDEGSSHWGHAVSNDLIHWKEYPVAINPDQNAPEGEKNGVLPGSVIVDKHNTLGKQTNTTKTLIAFYTNLNGEQKMAYSTDKGTTWTKYEKPVIPFNADDNARGPKVTWHEESKKWIMAIYRQTPGEDSIKGVSFYSSDNLTDWEWKSHTPNFIGSPDLVRFKVSNRPEETKWGLIDADGSYFLGSFDGKKFTPETPKIKSDWGKNYYSPQTFGNIPETDGRIIQIAYMRNGKFPNMPFNGQMTFPCKLSVKKYPSGYQIIKKPIREIEKIHFKRYSWENKNIIPGIKNNKLKRVATDRLHIIAELDIKTANNFGLVLCHSLKNMGTEIIYDVKNETLSVLGCSVPLKPVGGKIKFEILLDQTSIEVFANDGQIAVSNCFTPGETAKESVIFTNGGELEIDKMVIFDMESIW